MATAAFRWNFPPAWGDSLRTLTDILRETVFVSVEKVTRMRGSRGGPLPEVLSPPDERDKMRTQPNCHNCHRLPPTVTNTHCKNTNTHGKSTNTHGKNTGAHGKNTGEQRRGVRRQSHQRDWLRCAAAQTTRARTHARTEAGRAHSGGSTPGLPHPARVGFVTAATLNAATHGPALAERSPNAARCHDFAHADSARASRARQRRARQRRARQ